MPGILWQILTWLIFYVLLILSVAGDFISRSSIACREPSYYFFVFTLLMETRAGGLLAVPSSKMHRSALSPGFQTYFCIFWIISFSDRVAKFGIGVEFPESSVPGFQSSVLWWDLGALSYVPCVPPALWVILDSSVQSPCFSCCKRRRGESEEGVWERTEFLLEHSLDWVWGLGEVCPIYVRWDSQCMLLLDLPHICCILWTVYDPISSAVLSSGSLLPIATLPDCPLTLPFRVFHVSLFHLLHSLPISSFLQTSTVLLLLAGPLALFILDVHLRFDLSIRLNIRNPSSVFCSATDFYGPTFWRVAIHLIKCRYLHPQEVLSTPFPVQREKSDCSGDISSCRRQKLPLLGQMNCVLKMSLSPH